MSVPNGSGAIVTKVYHDAFGNAMASWKMAREPSVTATAQAGTCKEPG